MDLVSVIIPSHNRYDRLLHAISSVKAQTCRNFEIIVVDDGSSDPRYKEQINDVIVINLPRSSKQLLGYGCGAMPRNVGMNAAKGEYIAFLDDDDVWMPEKLEIQLSHMKAHGIDMSSTDGFIGKGSYNPDFAFNYKIYNREHYWTGLKKIFNLDNDLPDAFNLEFVQIHNPIITSSVIFKRELINKVGYMLLIRNGGQTIDGKKDWQDWNYWKKILQHTDCLYVKTPLFYYDSHHL